MTTVVTRGAASAQALGYASSSAAVNYVEDVFSTYLYTGNGSTQTITNGIDLAGKGGLVWTKNRNVAQQHTLADTARGIDNVIYSSLTNAQANFPTSITAISSTGYSLGSYSGNNNSGSGYVSWTFREQPKFFDIVTYTGNSTNRTIAHNLGSVPGTIIVKRTNTTGDWVVYHRSLGATKYVILNNTGAAGTYNGYWNDTEPTDTVFSLSGTSGDVNGTGNTYVAYLFAHNAGGFGLTGTDNVISCGSFTTDGSGNATVNLGYEPQYILMKKTNGVQNWVCYDTMRGWAQTQQAQLYPNITQAEDVYTGSPYFFPTATGFSLSGTFGLGNNDTFIYIAIRRGPMKVPTDATKVFTPIAATASTGTSRTVGFPADLTINTATGISGIRLVADRLRGYANASSDLPPMLDTNATTAERTSTSATVYNVWNTTALDGPYYNSYASIWWHFRRAPGFFDEVCYSGTGSATTVTHNLAAVPELMIIKARNSTFNWTVKRNASLDYAVLNSTQAFAGGFEAALWNSTEPTSSVFSLGTNVSVNGSGYTYVAYLFATVAGVSKVGSYTGTGTTLQINCGFTAGSRFVMIKRTDSTGDWYVWDSARGIVAGNDPYLLLNSTAAEDTSTDYVDTYSAGFEISSTAPAAINANGGSFIFLAIA